MNLSYYSVLEFIDTVEVERDKFAIVWKEKIFYVGELLFKVIQWLKEGKEIGEVQKLLLYHYKVDISIENLHNTIEESVLKKIINYEGKPKNSYIKGRICLMEQERITTISSYLSYFFNKFSFLIGASVSIVSNIWFSIFIFNNSAIYTKISMKAGIALALFNYVFLFLVGFVHELGHTSAARKYNIASKEIGLGFYFILPVLYADVSRVWLLNKYKRLLVNIGGIYFQLVINTLLVIIFMILHTCLQAYEWIPVSLFITNLAMAIRSLNPFFKNDGYWIYSDFFDVPNLSSQAQNFPIDLYKSIRKKNKMDFTKQTMGIGIYSVFKYILICMLPLWLINSIKHLITVFSEVIYTGGYIGNKSLLESYMHIFSSVFIFVLALLFNFKFLKNFYYRIQKLRGKNSLDIEEVPI